MTIWQQIEAIPRLSEAEELALASEIAKGNDRAVKKLVTANLWVAVPIALAMCRGHEVRGKWQPEDMLAEGTQALMDAAGRWDAKRGRFADYARIRVRGAMKDFLRKKADAVRGSGEQALSLDAPMGDEGETTLLERLESISDDAADDETHADILRGLSATQAEIIKRRVLAQNPDSIDEVARGVKCTVPYVRRTVAQFMARLSRC